MTTAPVDLGAVLLHDELDLAGEDLEEDDITGMLGKKLAQPVAQIVFKVVCAVFELLFGFDYFDNGEEVYSSTSVSQAHLFQDV